VGVLPGKSIAVIGAAAAVALIGAPQAAARTWYVSAAATVGADGSRANALGSLTAVERRSRPGDTIMILPASRPLDGGIVLKPRQLLVGAGPGARIENTHGDAVRLADGDTVENLTIGPANRGGIYGSNVSGVTVRGNDLSGTNTSCTTGFVVQPFKLPTLVPGVGVPFSSGLPNGWAAVMVDESRARARLRIIGNSVHDSACADGVDVRASGAARVDALVKRNSITRLRQGPAQQSVLAIGMQTTGTAKLKARLSHNAESYIGNALLGDQGFADSEGLFANSAGRSSLTEHVDHNVFAHGLGHLSANCFEVVSSNGGPKMNVTLTNSSCDHVVGDVLEAVNLSTDARMNFAIDHVRAAHSEFVVGPAFHQVEPGDDGDCLFELGAGAGSSTTVTVRDSLLTGCVTDGLEAAAAVDDGVGPVRKLSFDVRDSRITGNVLSNIRVATSSPVTELDGRVEHTDLHAALGTPVTLENLSSTRPRLTFSGANCIYGGALDIAAVRADASARGDWWGRPGGPPLGRVLAIGGSVDSAGALARPPAGTC
jgi:hypothetical protein